MFVLPCDTDPGRRTGDARSRTAALPTPNIGWSVRPELSTAACTVPRCRVPPPRSGRRPDDPRLADYVGLADPELRRRVEAERGFFIAESPLVVRRLVRSGRTRPVGARHARAARGARRRRSAGARRAGVRRAPGRCCGAVVGFDLHRGAVASADRWPLPTVDARAATAPGAVAVLAEAQRPRESRRRVPERGRARRSTRCCSTRSAADPLYRRCVRVSIGHVLHRSVDPAAVARRRARRRVHDCSRSRPRADADAARRRRLARRGPRCCSAPEGPGLSPAWLAAADAARPDPDAARRRLAQRRDRRRDRVLRRAPLDRGPIDRDPAVVDLDAAGQRDRVEQRAVVGDEQHRAREVRRAPVRAARSRAGRGGSSARRARGS